LVGAYEYDGLLLDRAYWWVLMNMMDCFWIGHICGCLWIW